MKKVGLLGHPLGHSASPAMHNAAYKDLGLGIEYIAFDVRLEELKDAIESFRGSEFLGFNVTIPYKEMILPYLDEITGLAKIIGAVNTVANRDGRLIGYNTDGPGFIESLNEDAGFSVKSKNCAILGAGGAGKAIAVMLAENGAKAVNIFDVDGSRSEQLARYICRKFKTKAKHIESDDIAKSIKKADLLVNATPIGMSPKIEACPIPEKTKLQKGLVVYDLVYNPQETKLLRLAKAAKAQPVSGLGMLVRQGALAFSIFTDVEPSIEVMWDAARHSLTR